MNKKMFVIVLLAVLLLSGCRATKVMQKEKLQAQEQVQQAQVEKENTAEVEKLEEQLNTSEIDELEEELAMLDDKELNSLDNLELG